VDDYYQLLGIGPNAAHAELRRAWRRLALRWHPDRAGSSATAIFQKIQAAYAVLSDPISRPHTIDGRACRCGRLGGRLRASGCIG
jgi:curved DNA-binding protein CbpA